MDKDKTTLQLEKILEFFLVDNPVGTGLGIAIGLCFYGSMDALVEKFGQGIAFLKNIKWYVYVALPLIVFNIPNFFRKHRLDRELETKMHYVEEAIRRGKLTEEDGREAWKNFLEESVREISGVSAGRKKIDPPTIAE